MSIGSVAIGSGPIAGPVGAAPVAGTDANLDVEIAFTSQPGAEVPAYVSVAQDVQSLSYTRGKQRELDRYQAGRGSVTLKNSDRKYDPTHSPGPLAVRFGGTGSDPGIIAAEEPTLEFTGNVDVRIKVSLDDWTPADDQNLIAFASDNLDFFLLVDTPTDIIMGVEYAGDVDQGFDIFSDPIPAFTNGTAHWLRATISFGTGPGGDDVTSFYWSSDYDPETQTGSWTQLTTTALSPLPNNTRLAYQSDDPLYIGVDGNGNAPLAGYVHYVELRNGINGTIIANPDFTQYPWQRDDAAGTQNEDAQGVEWTIFGDSVLEYLGDEPYIGNIKPQRRIRIPVTYAGVTHHLIEGYIDSWDQVRRGPHTGAAVVNFTDGFKVLNKAELKSSAYVQEVEADSPTHWWRLDEPSDTTTVFDSVGDYHLTNFSESPTFGAQGVVSREPGSAMEIDHDDEGVYLEGNRAPVVTGAPCTVEVVLSANTSSGGVLVFTNAYFGSSGFDDELVIRFDATDGEIEWAVFRNGSGTLATSTTTSITDGQSIHIACTWEASGALKIYRNGVDVTSGSPSVTAGSFSPTVFDELSFGNVPPNATDAYWGRYQFVAVYDQALSAERIAAHAEAVSTPWNNDSPGERAARVLDAISWPESRRELDDGSSTLQSATLGTSALEHVQKVAESEFGKLFISKQGNVRLMARETQWNRTPVGAITDDDHYQMSDPEYTDELIRNPATVSRSEGVAQTWKDQDGIDEYQRNSYTLDGLYHDDDDLSLYAAQYIVDVYKDPLYRISSITIKPKGDPSTLFPLLLALELGDWITIEETPQDVGSTTAQTAVVEGISLNWAPKDWTFTLSLSPADTRAYWLAGVDGYSNAGVSTRAGF